MQYCHSASIGNVRAQLISPLAMCVKTNSIRELLSSKHKPVYWNISQQKWTMIPQSVILKIKNKEVWNLYCYYEYLALGLISPMYNILSN